MEKLRLGEVKWPFPFTQLLLLEPGPNHRFVRCQSWGLPHGMIQWAMDLKVFLNHYNAILINGLIALANVPLERYILFTFHDDRCRWKTIIFDMAFIEEE